MKRILSLDGGGLGGVFSIQVLSAIEASCRSPPAAPRPGCPGKGGGDQLLDALRYLARDPGRRAAEQEMMCRVLGDCVHGAPLDTKLQSLNTPSLLTKDEQKFTYARDDQSMDALRAETPELPTDELDDAGMIPHLQKARPRLRRAARAMRAPVPARREPRRRRCRRRARPRRRRVTTTRAVTSH